MINHHQDGSEGYPTLFGFKTDNGSAAKMLNIVYILVMVVATAFAYHAIATILVSWPVIFVLLASLSVVGLPYCVKIIMYGRKEFTLKIAILCLVISLLPTIFDFVGFYSETGLRQSLKDTKFELQEKLSYFDQGARQAITANIIALDKNKTESESVAARNFNEKKLELLTDISNAEQAFLDEAEGVTSKRGIGPKARVLQAEVRKVTARVELITQELTNNYKKELENIDKNYNTQVKSLQEGIDKINELVSIKTDNSITLQINKAESFNDLSDIVVSMNTSLNTIGSKLGVTPDYIKFDNSNIIELSFSALSKLEITAIVCFALAFLLEMVDTIIVYMVRGTKAKRKKVQAAKAPAAKKPETPEIQTVIVKPQVRISSTR